MMKEAGVKGEEEGEEVVVVTLTLLPYANHPAKLFPSRLDNNCCSIDVGLGLDRRRLWLFKFKCVPSSSESFRH